MRAYAKDRVKELGLSGPDNVRINQAGCLDRCELDVRPGGRWLAHGYRPDGGRFAKQGVYREVKRPERLVFTWPHQSGDGCTDGDGQETTVEVTFRAVAGRTEVTLVHGPFPDRAGFEGHNDGWLGCFAKLAAFLEN